MRVALINRYSPGSVPSHDSELASTPGWELRIFYCLDRPKGPVANLPFTYKKSYSISYKRKVRHTGSVKFNDVNQVVIPLGLWFDLWRYDPDVIISVEMGFSSFVSAVYAFIARKPFVLRHYGTLHSEREISWKQKALRKFLITQADAFIGMGKEARENLRALTIDDNAIFDARNAVDMLPFMSDVKSDRRTIVRNDLGINGLCYLYVGQMIARKGLDYLLDAWDLFSQQVVGSEAYLLMVGDGNQRDTILQRAERMAVKNVRCLPFVQPENLPEIYNAADVFVFPTLQDVWGLVVNEAMASRLPVICSKYAGASELIIEGRNGWIVDPLDREDLGDKLREVWDARHQIQAMGTESQKLISPITITSMAEGFRRAVMYALSR